MDNVCVMACCVDKEENVSTIAVRKQFTIEGKKFEGAEYTYAFQKHSEYFPMHFMPEYIVIENVKPQGIRPKNPRW